MAKKSSKGRPSKFNAKIAAEIVESVRQGNYIETAAAFAGIAKDTLYRWLREGARAKQGNLRDFSYAVKKAQAQAEIGFLGVINQAAHGHESKVRREVTKPIIKKIESRGEDGEKTVDYVVVGESTEVSEEIRMENDWRAAAWRLERMFPDRFGRKVEAKIKGAQDGDDNKPVEQMSEDEINTELAEMLGVEVDALEDLTDG